MKSEPSCAAAAVGALIALRRRIHPSFLTLFTGVVVVALIVNAGESAKWCQKREHITRTPLHHLVD